MLALATDQLGGAPYLQQVTAAAAGCPPRWSAQKHRLVASYEAAGGQVAQLVRWDLGVEGPVELLQRLLLLEAGPVQPLGQHLGLPPVYLVIQQQGQELQVPQLLVLGLGSAQLHGVEHLAQAQRLEFSRWALTRLLTGKLPPACGSTSPCP